MAKKQLKIDPLTSAKNALRMFQAMEENIDFLHEHVKGLVVYNKEHAAKVVSSLEKKEEEKMDSDINQMSIPNI